MQRPQLELWSAEPHRTPPLYQQLTPQQRSSLLSHLAQLILKLVQAPPPTPPPPSTPTQIKVIDEDLAHSASGVIIRPGFTQMTNEVAMGQVGILLCREASRVARNNAEW